jgi:flavin reductase (DIM6/NTAB) family NADH-FMN oxidoreductase RutF
VTIHAGNPYAAAARDPVREVRGRLVAPVTIWTAREGRARVGWTISSVLIADGSPPEVVGLLDVDSDLEPALSVGAAFVVNLLGWQHRQLADSFAGLAPAPGGVFKRGAEWRSTEWGPVLADAPAWLGVRVAGDRLERAGWTRLVRGRIEHLELGPDAPDGLLAHIRGRYLGVAPPGRGER